LRPAPRPNLLPPPPLLSSLLLLVLNEEPNFLRSAPPRDDDDADRLEPPRIVASSARDMDHLMLTGKKSLEPVSGLSVTLMKLGKLDSKTRIQQNMIVIFCFGLL